MNIIILTGRFGMGHVKAAEAIKEQILTEKPDSSVEIIDFMDHMFPAVSKYIYKGFNFLVGSCSGLYNTINKAAGSSHAVPLKVTMTHKIDRLMADYRPDCIVVAFPVCSQYISAYKQIRRCRVPLYTYITDITAHAEWIAPATDRYFVGDVTTKTPFSPTASQKKRSRSAAYPCCGASIKGCPAEASAGKRRCSLWAAVWGCCHRQKLSCGR